MIDIEIENLMVFDVPVAQKVVEKDFSEDGDDCSVDGEANNEEQSKKRRRITVVWSFVKQFDNETFVESEIRSKWTQKKTHQTLVGTKMYFDCKYPKCPAHIHLLYIKNQPKISLFADQSIDL